jgi:hypothetical protein
MTVRQSKVLCWSPITRVRRIRRGGAGAVKSQGAFRPIAVHIRPRQQPSGFHRVRHARRRRIIRRRGLGDTDAQSAGGVQNLELAVVPVMAET